MAADPIVKAAKRNRSAAFDRMSKIVDGATTANRGLNSAENYEFNELEHQIKNYDAQIAEDKRLKKSTRNAAIWAGEGVIRSEPMTYGPNSANSWLLDTAAIAGWSIGAGDASEAKERMSRHLKEVSVEARTNKKTARMLAESRFGNPGSTEYRVNPNTSAGTGGEFTPPLWLISQYVPFARPGRTFANRCVNNPLPPGIDVINIPKITTGSQAAIQSANAAAIQSVDIVTSTVASSVNTIAGQEDISMQLLEQSPIAMDGVVFEDLSRDYDQRLDLQVIAGTGTNGQHLGVLNVASQTSNTSILKANAVTVSSALFFDGSTAATQYRSIVNGVSAIESVRYASPTAVWVHPRRANSWAFAADSSTANSGRPLYVASKYGALNDLGQLAATPVPQGVAGEVFGLPVIKDANMPTTMNNTATTGGTADAVVVLKEDDLMLWEGQIRMRALPEILSGTLQIRYQCFAYSSFQPGRFLPSISILTGNTGLAVPTY